MNLTWIHALTGFRFARGSGAVATGIVISRPAPRRTNQDKTRRFFAGTGTAASATLQQLASARLESLCRQIEPHFLFNTLATVRRLQHVEPELGARLLAHFVAYLRAAQPSRQGEGKTLGQEIDLTRAYLNVLAVRMAGRLQVSVEVADNLRGLPFPPLTIATLVENAVKHGIAPAPAGGSIAVTVQRVGDVLHAVVADTGVGFNGGGCGDSGSGIGLANVRSRLQILHGNAGTLTLQHNLPSGTRATLRLPCEPSGGWA